MGDRAGEWSLSLWAETENLSDLRRQATAGGVGVSESDGGIWGTVRERKAAYEMKLKRNEKLQNNVDETMLWQNNEIIQ